MTTTTCPRCGEAKHRGRCKGGGSVKARNTPPAAQKASAPPPAKLDGLALEVARGFGFRASAEDGQLVIEQDADDGTASIVLSKTELRVLAAQFAEWAQS